MSLKYKLTLIFAAALIILMAITALLAQRVARVAVEHEIQEQVETAYIDTRNALQREVQRRGYLNDANAFAVVTQSLSAHSNIKKVDLTYWVNNVPNGFSFPLSPYWLTMARLKPGDPAFEPGGRTYRKEFTFTLYGGIFTRLKLEASLTDADLLAARLARTFLFVTGGALLVVLGIIYYLAHWLVSAPLGELLRVTRRVTEGDLEVAPTTRLALRRDEVGILSTAFQDMLSALRRARDENQTLLNRTQGFNRELEARVQEATSALADQNQALATINAALIDAREELSRRERLAALGQLAGSIAHELGTPLSTLSGYLQLTLADPALKPELREPLEVASGEARRMTRIIRRFLDSTRGLRPVPESFELEPLIRNVVELTVPEGARSRHPVRIDLRPEASTLCTDPGLMRQVLINLVNNALDAMGDSGGLIFRGVREGEELVLEVEDEGPGIPLEQREQIFTPFFTTKEPGRGTGLGLAICREIVRALKGTLTVEDPLEGRGARFILRVPAFQERRGEVYGMGA
jgi:signal transduction histidine kinase